ncbi:MAG: hypothetical protein A2605_02275 [Candidatus Zambryskibacteria bacterium RIFOXYD1_FULL_39_35]|nr:MAG: hypothetical protein A2605_02275 [Candidatus Zambryskibacteria bacterium RIFOXYD1_FULL_39_35]
MSDSKIIFITGSSGVGKSTLLKKLKSSLSAEKYAMYDFDELGVPLDADNGWRIDTTKIWLAKAEENIKNGITTIIAGLTYPKEVMNLTNNKNIKFFILKVSENELRKRLFSYRFSTDERIEKLKKYEGVTPEEFIVNNRKMITIMDNEGKIYNASFVDTDNLAPDQVAEKIIYSITKNI